MDKIGTTETPEIEVEVTEAEAPKVAKKTRKKAASPKPAHSSTEAARERVKMKLAAANRPNKADMLDRLDDAH